MLQGLANLQQFLATRPRAERPVSGLESFAKAIPGAIQAGMQGYQMGQDIDAQRQQNVMQKLMAGQKPEEAPGAVKDLQTLLMTKTPKQELYQKASETKIAELGDKWNEQNEAYSLAKDIGSDEKTINKLFKSLKNTEKEISEYDKIKSGAEKGNLLERLKLHSIAKEQTYKQAVDVFNKNADMFGEMREAKYKAKAGDLERLINSEISQLFMNPIQKIMIEPEQIDELKELRRSNSIKNVQGALEWTNEEAHKQFIELAKDYFTANLKKRKAEYSKLNKEQAKQWLEEKWPGDTRTQAQFLEAIRTK